MFESQLKYVLSEVDKVIETGEKNIEILTEVDKRIPGRSIDDRVDTAVEAINQETIIERWKLFRDELILRFKE